MRIRDHYKTLEVHPQATLQEIKKAYRRLAHRYHPDKNAANAWAGRHFHEIREAYEVLSHPKRRAAYDEERWLAGYARNKKPEAVTPAWIYNECLRLASHMTTVDTYRMSREALYAYAELLLSDTHMAILQRAGEAELNARIAEEVLRAVKDLQYRYFKELVIRLELLAGEDDSLRQRIERELQRKKKDARWHRYKPWLIVSIAVLLCLLMFFYARLVPRPS